MFGIRIPEILTIAIIVVFFIMVVTAMIVFTVFLLKKWGQANLPLNKPYLFCPKCGAKLDGNEKGGGPALES